MENRVTDPGRVSSAQIDAILARGLQPTIQFSRNCYSKPLLGKINDLCLQYGDSLEVRFYGHYSGAFDAAALAHIPDVQWLSIDCLLRIDNPTEIYSLNHIRKFGFGVHYFNQKDFLAGLKLPQIRHLVLVENERRNLDLAPLAACSNLESLYLNGHTKNIVAISKLPKLRQLSLGSMPSKLELAFVRHIPRLEKLTLILGGRTDIDDLEHDNLHELEIQRVRGIEKLGDLQRFPKLRRLLVEDQIRLSSVLIEGSRLEEVYFHNCKKLTDLPGLLELSSLREFGASRTSLDMEKLLHANWPASVEKLGLYSSSEKWNKMAREYLDSRGYR